MQIRFIKYLGPCYKHNRQMDLFLLILNNQYVTVRKHLYNVDSTMICFINHGNAFYAVIGNAIETSKMLDLPLSVRQDINQRIIKILNENN